MSDESGRYQPDRAAIQVDAGVWLLDLGFQDHRGVVAAYLLHDDRRLALIECGPSSTLPHLREAVRQAGFALEQVTDLLITHIHLDHAGAAGPLARANPALKVYVHPFGAPHMIDPSKLVSSASRIYGDKMETLWGEVAPVREAQLAVLKDGQMVTAGGRSLQALFTPGHAWHHVAWWDRDEGALFTGDVGGVRLPGTGYACPPTPPPDLDPAAWRESLAKMAGCDARRWYLTHFGPVDDVAGHAAQLEENLARFLQIGAASFAAGEDQAALTARLQAEVEAQLGTVDQAVLTNLEWATPAYMAAMGLTRYETKRAKPA